jgi:hypothetical protein
MDTYKCKRTANPLVIDGNLNKPEWEQAQKVSLVETVTGEPPKQKTWSKLLWDDTNLYVAFCNIFRMPIWFIGLNFYLTTL